MLARIVGEENVAAVDPSEPFVAALTERFPAADVRTGAAEELPFADDSFDAVFAQLVMNFLRDPERGVDEMLRVARGRGRGGGRRLGLRPGEMTLLTTFWEAARRSTPAESRPSTSGRACDSAGKRPGRTLARRRGPRDDEAERSSYRVAYESFDELWEPFTRGVGPAGAYAASLEPEALQALCDEYYRRLGSPEGPFELTARAWYAVGTK